MTVGVLTKTALEIKEGPGTVKVTRKIAAPAGKVWEALTSPHLVVQWFGMPSAELRLGRSLNLDFGDGDFFLLKPTHIDPPDSLQYQWSFLGIGPQDTITWTIVPQGDGCVVTVRDDEPARSGEGVRQMKKGWLDFTSRLKGFLQTGRPTRYSWRRELDASIELSGAPAKNREALFQPEKIACWLPLDGSALKDEALLIPSDGLEPSALKLTDVCRNESGGVDFNLSHDEWLAQTRCQIELSPYSTHSLLSVSHNQWQDIHKDTDYQKQQRRRFCQFWIATLQRAARLTQSNATRDALN
jgi:uncharacterized protein YndB with AHSA1/START domain